MDEIICPECGRPNLIEAEKCWYCQVPLVSQEYASEELSEPDAEQAGEETTNNRPSAPVENEENLPEWLKRIRELKKADTPVEEVDEWQQEKLFPGLVQDPDGPVSRSDAASRQPRLSEKPDTKPEIPEDQPMLDEAPVEKVPEEELPQNEEGLGDSENELPDGFTPLEH